MCTISHDRKSFQRHPIRKISREIKNYVLKNFVRDEDVVSMIVDLKDPKSGFETKFSPTDLDDEDQSSATKVKIWELKVKKYLDREEKLEKNTNKIYALTIGQCTPVLHSMLKGDPDYDTKSCTFDALWLLQRLKILTASVDTKANLALVLHEQLLAFMTIRQGQNESEDEYLQRFNSRVKSLEMSGGSHIFTSPQLLKKFKMHLQMRSPKRKRDF